MPRNGRAWLFISLLVSCKADSRPARNDAIAPPAVTSRPVGAENSVASLAGDTLELVSVGGRQLRTDSVFLARDIDGSGKTDYVVREIKLSPIAHMRAYRIAVYLDKDPGTAKPDWAMEFDDEFGRYQTLGKSLSMAPGVSLLDIQWSGADYDADEILVVQRGSIRQEISHGVDYGHGYLDIRQERGKVVVEATLEHLQLRGTPVTSEISCKEPKSGAMQLAFNAQKGQFMPDRVVCGSPK